jgi:lysyl-tRNA synthetase class 2
MKTARVLACSSDEVQVLIADQVLRFAPGEHPLASTWRVGDLVCLNSDSRFGEVVYRPERFDPTGDVLRWRRPAQAPGRMELLRQRHQLLRGIREWFDAQGFLEVETPVLVPAPSPEAQFQPFQAGSGFLITSPEYQMKRLLVGGFEQIYQLVRCFRGQEVGKRHNPEFTMLEWYRAEASLQHLMSDIEGLVGHLRARFAELAPELESMNWNRPWLRVRISELFREHLHLELEPPSGPLLEAPRLREAAEAQGYGEWIAGAQSYDDVFFRLWDRLEPRLGWEAPLFVHDWPLPLASLARPCPGHPGFADRVELYIRGVELGNGFGELTDAREQRRRFEADLQNRLETGREVVPLDEPFLQALEQGMPESAGMALGVDRLVMLLTNAPDLRSVMAFSWEER